MVATGKTGWRGRTGLDVLLRAGGIVLILIAAAAAWALDGIAGGQPRASITVLDDLLAALAFVGASIGGALLFAGARLFDQVEVGERWVRRPRIRD